jgi:hypothetical protein
MNDADMVPELVPHKACPKCGSAVAFMHFSAWVDSHGGSGVIERAEYECGEEWEWEGAKVLQTWGGNHERH